MDIRTEGTAQGDGASIAPSDTAPSGGERTLWDAVGALYRRWKLITAVTVVAATLSVAIALLLPKWYAAEARVLQPEGGAISMLSGIAGSVGGGLGSLLGGASGEYTRYLAILTSRSLLEDVVEEFDLIEVYGIEDSEVPTFAAVQKLRENVEFEVDPEFLFLTVRAYDREPWRAAAMANYMVAALNEEHARLASQSARQSRIFIEERLNDAQDDLDSVRTALQEFQEEHGVVELESQAQAFMTSVAELKGAVAQLEVRYQTLARQYGPDNPRVQAAREALAVARAQVAGAFGGRDELLPISMQALPALSRRYAELMQGQLTQARILETIYPIYEQAQFQEESDAVAVQVVDEAVPPAAAARPSRRLIAVLGTGSAFFFVVVYVLAEAWLRWNRGRLAVRLQQALRPA
jgi:tyrosine-protein kinase Etk/Wzc